MFPLQTHSVEEIAAAPTAVSSKTKFAEVKKKCCSWRVGQNEELDYNQMYLLEFIFKERFFR